LNVRLSERYGRIFADLTIGANVAGAVPLQANDKLSCPGVKLHGAGFIVSQEEARQLGLGRIPGLESHIRPYRNGRDLTAIPREVLVIDLHGLSEDEVRRRYPEVYQWILDRVKPERDHNKRDSYRQKWWTFGEPRGDFRPALDGLARYISTVETAKHRVFVFLEQSILPDNKLVNIATYDAYHLGVLSSRVHVTWALAAGSRLGVGNDPVYVKSRCFEPFPFPTCNEALKERIRELAEALDAHRKARQALHPGLTLTDMYNVLEKLRAGGALSAKEREVHEKGLVSVLRQLHDDLDDAVFAAYGWPAALADEKILERLVALNRERAREEEQGLVRWLRPEYQAPQGAAPGVQVDLGLEEGAAEVAPKARAPWPKSLPEQVQAIRAAIAAHDRPVTAKELAKGFERARADKVQELLKTLASLGQAREVGDEKFVE
jgi:hypothetical protein